MNNDGTLYGSFSITSPDLLHFNGTNTYVTIPVNVQTETSWKATIELSTTSTSSGSAIYNQPCIFGYDSGGYRSRDFHIDISGGNLYIFSGLSGTNSSSQLNYGTLTTSGGDFGWNTQQSIADGNLHTIEVEASYSTNTITVTLDSVNLGYLNVVNTINSTYLALGSSYNGERKYAEFDLKSFAMDINDSPAVEYTNFTSAEITAGVLTDSSVITSASVTPVLFITSTSAVASATPKLFVTTVPWSASITTSFDTSRNIINEETILADTLREVTDGVTTTVIEADTKRNVIVEDEILADTSREVKVYTYLSFSTLRNVVNDSKRQKAIEHDVLTLAPKTNLDSVANVDSIINFDFNGGLNLAGEYQIPTSHRIYNESGDLACVDVDVDAEAYNINQWIDLAENFDGIQDFDGEDISSFVRVTPYIRLSSDGTTYNAWQKVISGAQYKGKYYDFKLALVTTDPNTTVFVRNFKYTVRQ